MEDELYVKFHFMMQTVFKPAYIKEVETSYTVIQFLIFAKF